MSVSKELKESYQPVIGLEVHAQLLTQTKIFNSDSTEYGNLPNTNVGVVTLGHPGTLPVLNKSAVEKAILMGLACGCDITEYNIFARKNYFYPDLPKGYQISQDRTPICTKGSVRIKLKSGLEKTVNLTRIHMEEDAGKSIHLDGETDTLVDFNKAGVPLIEIVSEPEISSGEEAYQYLTEIRKLVRYLEICDGNMEEGSLRCDANISVMKKGAGKFGTRVEVKNMNSIRNVQRAIEHEIERQIELIESGGKVVQQTRQFDAVNGTTNPLRAKEGMNDYRYFPEPDLTPLLVKEGWISEIRASLPPLPNELYDTFVKKYGLPEYDASVLTDSKEIALYFHELCNYTKNYKAASNWVMVQIKGYLNELSLTIQQFPLNPQQIAELIEAIDRGIINSSIATQKVFPLMLENTTKSVEQLIQENGLGLEGDDATLENVIREIFQANPAEFERLKNGEKKLIGMFMGQIMKQTKGKADPKKTSQLIEKIANG